MKTMLDCLAVMPVGPRSKLEYVQDTLASFLYYFESANTLLLIIDDTRSNFLKDRIPGHPQVRVVSTQCLFDDITKGHNTRGLLFVKQMAAVQMLSKEYDWKCLLRLDDDALVIGPSPHLDAIKTFELEPQIGILGAYLRRGNGQDKRPALRRQGRRLLKRLVSRDIIRNPKMVMTLAVLIAKAKSQGYKLGDMCTGGSLFLSRSAYDRIQRICGDDLNLLRHSDLAEDLLLALCNAAAGFKMKDFSDKDDIMAINWRGLPMPLDELVKRKKKIIHPVKDPKNQDHERKVRDYFKNIRSASVTAKN